MSTKTRLNQALKKWNLLKHPFYQAWSAGTLPIEALRTYAREYGAFIRLLPQGWETLMDLETSNEEREHAELWDDFAAALDTRVTDEAGIAEVQTLIASAARLFADPISAVGAMYAFEVQQPATAQSKLDGLKAYYRLPAGAESYFKMHSHNEHEARKLLDRIEATSADDQAHAVQACAEMAHSLWNGLSGIYDKDCNIH